MIKDNLKNINKRINAACKKVGRDPSEIAIVAVTKGVDPYTISDAFMQGMRDIGENRVQEAQKKKANVLPGAKWHMIGHLQTNKVKDALELFDLIHSLDSIELARKIDKEANKAGKIAEVLVQVNTSGEEAKYGIKPEEASNFLREVSALQHIKVLGLMTITPLAEDAETVRPHLKRLREIYDAVSQELIPNIEMKYLSMGMSQDFDIAIEEGANMVRIGSAIFKES